MKHTKDIWKDFAYQICKELNLEIRCQKKHKHPNDRPEVVVDVIQKVLAEGIQKLTFTYKIYSRKLTSWRNVVNEICKYRQLYDGSNNMFFRLNAPAYNVSKETLIELELKGFTDLLKAFNRV